jgi:(3S)-malyl-CoA thioesterase
MNKALDVPQKLKFVRSALYVPASNARALEKAQGLDADMLIIDLEDAVASEGKADARTAAMQFVNARAPDKLLAIRINSADSRWFDDDVVALRNCRADLFVLPKVEAETTIDRIWSSLSAPLLAMIETPAGLYSAREIAAHHAVGGLIAGTNDIAAETGIKPGSMRQGLELSLQTIVLAASASGKPRFDGVCNLLDNRDRFEAECAQGYGYGFTGKTLIHPNQIAGANRAFAPDAATVTEAEELVAASRGGAQRFKGRMIEAMHVEEAKMTIERSRHATGGF